MTPILEAKFQTTSTDEGTFEGLASVFHEPDRSGDSVQPGAFRASLDRLAKSQTRLPLKYDHRTDIGVIEHAEERAEGLHVKGRLFMELPEARTAHQLMKAGAAFMSFGYIVPKGGSERKGDITLLHAVDLIEVTITSTPMHPSATITRVKHVTGPADLERILRDGGLPVRAAKKVAAAGWPVLANEPHESELVALADRLSTVTKSLRNR